MKITGNYHINSYNYNTYPASKNKESTNGIFFQGNLLSLSKNEISQKIRDSIKADNFIGRGTEAEVYRIENTDYCVRLPYESIDMYCYDYSKKLTSADRINHVKAKLGFGASILPIFQGETLKKYISDKDGYNKLQNQAADMPIKSYTKILRQIATAIDNDMLFDFSAGNLIINPKKNTMTAIDFIGMSSDNPRAIRPMYEMYSVLTSYGAENPTKQKLFEKIALAGLDEFYPKKIPCMDVALFDFEELIKKYTSQKTLAKNISKVFEDLRKIKKLEITDKTKTNFLKARIINAKQIIKSI